MKIYCQKCKKQITEDLYKVKVRWTTSLFGSPVVANVSKVFDIEVFTDDEGYRIYDDRGMKRGLFFISKKEPALNNKWCEDSPAQIIRARGGDIVVGQKSILPGIIPKFKSGYGCCDYSGGYPLHCECGNKLGRMYLDCYESKCVHFIQKNVDRIY